MFTNSVGRRLCICAAMVSVAAFVWLATESRAQQEEKPAIPSLKEWEADVRKRMSKDDKLKRLATKYPLVILCSRQLYAGGHYGQSAYSFVLETSDPKKHQNRVQIVFHNGGHDRSFQTNLAINQQNLVVDLGKVDFEVNPTLGKISIDHPGLGHDCVAASEGHVYLERVRDRLETDLGKDGNNFYVVFQVVAVDSRSRYMAFLWRKMPGGKVVKQPEEK